MHLDGKLDRPLIAPLEFSEKGDFWVRGSEVQFRFGSLRSTLTATCLGGFDNTSTHLGTDSQVFHLRQDGTVPFSLNVASRQQRVQRVHVIDPDQHQRRKK